MKTLQFNNLQFNNLIGFIFITVFIFLFFNYLQPQNKNRFFVNHVFIICGDKIGSGVVVSKNYILTANHILSNDSIIVVNEKLIINAKFVSKNRDIALLFVDYNLYSIYQEAKDLKVINGVNLIKPFESVFWVQPVFDNDVEKFFILANTGIISAISDKEFLINKEAFPMVSGAGIFNYNNELIGIATRTYKIGDKYSYLIADFILDENIISIINDNK